MLAPELSELLSAVRRRLWRGLLVSALRVALWGSAALLLLSSVVALVAGPTPGVYTALVVPVLWVLMLVRAMRRRPADADCALWADRHLGGASAFTTVLELSRSASPPPDSAALRRLLQWSTRKAPESLKALASRPDPARLARPLLATTVCASLAALVLDLSDSMPPPLDVTAGGQPALAGDRAASGIAAPAGDALASDLAAAVRAADARQGAAERQPLGRTPEAADGKSGGGPTPPGALAMALPADAQRGGGASKSVAIEEAIALDRTHRAANADSGSGREAGDTPARQSASSRSHPLQGTMVARGYELQARPRSGDMQADMNREGSYDDEPTAMGPMAAPATIAVAAATPPTATDSLRLTPTQTSYVQAWTKASTQRR